ncbi:hypothetical protein F5Y14DRAFT_380943 [Nemania sp. NC0429]|nr:hypothetical protein F5Y14DRAFT_380943 [Nemania sp. NC0429]
MSKQAGRFRSDAHTPPTIHRRRHHQHHHHQHHRTQAWRKRSRMSGSPVPIIPAGADQYEWARRWPRRRGGFEIEKQCARCRWWFDSFDPQCTKCHICEEDGSDSHNPSAALIRSIPVRLI